LSLRRLRRRSLVIVLADFLSPMPRIRPALARLRHDGYVRANIDGELAELAEPPALDPNKRHTIEVFIDRLGQEAGVALSQQTPVAFLHSASCISRCTKHSHESGVRSEPASVARAVRK